MIAQMMQFLGNLGMNETFSRAICGITLVIVIVNVLLLWRWRKSQKLVQKSKHVGHSVRKEFRKFFLGDELLSLRTAMRRKFLSKQAVVKVATLPLSTVKGVVKLQYVTVKGVVKLPYTIPRGMIHAVQGQRRRWHLNRLLKESGDGLSTIYSSNSRGSDRAVPPPLHRSKSRSFVENNLTDARKMAVFSALRATDLIGCFNNDSLNELMIGGRFTTWKKGETIFGAKDHRDCVTILLSGSVTLENSAQQLYVSLDAGQSITAFLEWLDLIMDGGYVTPVAAIANEPCEVLCIPASRLNELFTKYPNMKTQLIRLILVRLNRTTLLTIYKCFRGIGFLDLFGRYGSENSKGEDSIVEVTPKVNIPKELSFKNVRNLVFETLNLPKTALKEIIQFSNDFSICSLRENEWMHESLQGDAVYLVLKGGLRVGSAYAPFSPFADESLVNGSDKSPSPLHAESMIAEGEWLGQLSAISNSYSEWYGGEGIRPTLVVRGAKDTGCEMLRMSHNMFQALLEKYPEILEEKARRMVDNYRDGADQNPKTSLLLLYNTCVQSIRLRSGSKLLDENKPITGVYVVLYGRLCHANAGGGDSNSNGAYDISGSYGAGSIVGLREFFSRGDMSSIYSLSAARDTQLLKIPRSFLEMLMRQYPQFILQLHTSLTSSGIMNGNSMNNIPKPSNHISGIHGPSKSVYESLKDDHEFTIPIRQSPKLPPRHSGLRNIALIPLSENVPIGSFAHTLAKVLKNQRSVKHLIFEDMQQRFGDELFSDVFSDLALRGWVGLLEEGSSMLLFEGCYGADTVQREWTEFCVRQADLILFVGDAAEGTPNEESLKTLESTNNGSSKNKLPQLQKSQRPVFFDSIAARELILLHFDPEPDYLPTGTREWIKTVSVQHHHHIRVHSFDSEFDCHDINSDFRRLSRWLTGHSIGVTLSGGGARGNAHVGVLRGLEDDGMPIDMICGTSMGAYVGALYAMYPNNHLQIHYWCQRGSNGLGSKWNMVKDLTLPFTSYFSGDGLNGVLYEVFGELKIEDLWIPYFCVTTDLFKMGEVTHRNGCLWRYVRASMSLAGYFPPICDEIGNNVHYLVDGGYCNNLPADLMKEALGPETIIAVDVGRGPQFKQSSNHNFGDQLSGLDILMIKLHLKKAPPSMAQAPSMADISDQLTYVCCEKRLMDALERDIDLYLRPPVQAFSTLEFNQYPSIRDIGYDNCIKGFTEWKKTLKPDHAVFAASKSTSRHIKRSMSLPTITFV